MKKRGIFLDRDGTIIKEKHYLKHISEIELIDGAVNALLLLQNMGFRLFIITNQSGIRRGYISEKQLNDIHKKLKNLLKKQGVIIDHTYYSPHLPHENSKTRKPATGLVKTAAQDYGIHLNGSYCIGDKKSDIKMGKNIGLKTILVLTGYGRKTVLETNPDYIAVDIMEAAEIIREEESKER
jgi:D-glycero-D-manno-heptose 1,7-bisphosphate phosphatase